ETVALIAGGHSFGKAHGAASPENHVGPEPEAGSLEEQGFGWTNKYGKGKGADTITSGLEGAWTATPAEWSHGYFENLMEYDWELTKSPAGAWQWKPTDGNAADDVPDAHDPNKRHAPMMFTTDLALKKDPAYAEISKRFYENPEQFEQAFAKAWYKLVHRDMGPVSRCLGPWVAPPQIWQDPVPVVNHPLVNDADIANLKTQILVSGLSSTQLVTTAWASASTFRGTDKRGGANGARIRLAPQKDWAVNEPEKLQRVLGVLERIQTRFNRSQRNGKRISMADMIVLAGCAGVESASSAAGVPTPVPFTPGRTDATDKMTDAASFDVLEPRVDAFRNFFPHDGVTRPVPEQMVDRAHLLTLSAPEMTVLVGGLRSLNVTGVPNMGVLTAQPGKLSNDFFVNLLDMNTKWTKSKVCDHFFEGTDRETGEVKWTASAADLVFGSNSQLRALSEVYAADDAKEKFVKDFVAAWDKVMSLDRFDLE
ncbi:MAG: peroxidase family protein, partial [Planctomycetota bacterium]